MSDNAQLMKEWDWEKNTELGLDPNKLLFGSNKRAYWICSQCGNHWGAIIANRTKGNGCSICAHQRIGKSKIKFALNTSGTLAERYPSIATEWSGENTLSPNDISPGSNKMFLWICPQGHSYKASVANRIRGTKCPICAGKKVLKGYNDLITLYPFVKDIWNYSRNIGIDPEKCTGKSHRVVWWICSNGHEWESKISHITDGHTCPYCSGQRSIVGVNDIKTTNPQLAKEWDYEKNTIPTETVMQSSGKKYWWKCQYGHSWQATAAHRTAGEGCPVCASTLRTSFPEKAIFYYISKKSPDAIGSFRTAAIVPYELDIFLPTMNIAIEYDGEFYHQDISRDLAKDTLCNKLGIQLLRVREPNCPQYETSAKLLKMHSLSTLSLEQIISDILMLAGFKVEIDFVDIDRDRIKIDELRVYTRIENSFGESFPQLISEWNIERNGNITPYSVTKYSGRKVWWKCKICGYEWKTIIANRAKGSGCPSCAKANASTRAFNREREKKAKKERTSL